MSDIEAKHAPVQKKKVIKSKGHEAVDRYDHSRGMENIGDYPDSHEVDDFPGIDSAAKRHQISHEDAKRGLID